ncbi:MAG: T9SS type A sorting domain-containing protein [Bacteroidales bacterium]
MLVELYIVPSEGFKRIPVSALENDSFIETTSTKVNEVQKENIIKNISPNPAKENCTINLNNNGKELNIFVIDTQGQITYNKVISTNSHTINTQDFNPGIYIIKILDGKSIIASKKIIVIR